MRGVRALGFATLLLAGVVAAPALSPAQGSGAEVPPPASTEPETTLPGPPPDEDPAAPEKERVESQGAAPASASAPQNLAIAHAAESQGAEAAASASVSVGDNFYSPAMVTVKVGDTVSWRNNGQAPHSATADDGSFDTGVFDPGQSRSNTFNQAGTFTYFCTVHGQAQSGTVRVESAGAGSGSGGGSGSGSGSGGGSGGTGGATVPGPSEADAAAAPNAAGNSNFLPATGFGALALAAVGLALLAAGTLLERRQDAAGS